MSSRLKLAGICFAAAFALAACGGGGGSGTSMTPTEPPPPAGPTADSITVDAADALVMAQAAGKAAMDAEDNAIKYAGMLGPASVKGESMTAEMNAQMILDAQDAVKMAVMNAETALDDAKAAKMAAEALPEDDPGRAGAIAAAEAAIAAANTHMKAAQAILDKNPLQTDGTTPTTEVDSLKEAVAKVTNPAGDATAPDPAKTPKDAGEAVATAIRDAIDTNAEIGTTAVPATPAAATDVVMTMENRQAKTWAMIVGEDDVMKMRIATTATDTDEVDVASVTGMTAADLHATSLTATGGTGGGNAYADGFQTDNAGTYKGIPGTVVCGGDDCKVGVAADGEANVGKLLGSWYFTPRFPKETYVMPANANSYTAETDYATYGYWFQVAANGAVTVNTVAGRGTPADGTAAPTTTGNVIGAATDDLELSASYTGTATGISAVQTFSSGGQTSIKSGSFTADVRLDATFGPAARISGRVWNFQGDAVGAWTVMLTQPETGADFVNAGMTAGVAKGGGDDGVWTAIPHGPDDAKRPTGIFGRFNAHFSNGHAAGAYATRKD